MLYCYEVFEDKCCSQLTLCKKIVMSLTILIRRGKLLSKHRKMIFIDFQRDAIFCNHGVVIGFHTSIDDSDKRGPRTTMMNDVFVVYWDPSLM